jgi:hypothetical protein
VRLRDRGYVAAFFWDEEGEEVPDHYDALEGGADWQQRHLCFRAKEGTARAVLCFRLIDDVPISVASASVGPVSRKDVLAWADATWAALPELLDEKPSMHKLVSFTRRMADGDTVRVVIIGDSIANDAGNGPWDMLLERDFPGCRIELCSAVGSGTPFSPYTPEDVFERRIERWAPDLAVLCSRSARRDWEGAQKLLQMLNDRTEAVALVCTDPFGGDGDPREKLPNERQPGTIAEGTARLRGVAESQGAAFYDLWKAWRDYIATETLSTALRQGSPGDHDDNEVAKDEIEGYWLELGVRRS